MTPEQHLRHFAEFYVAVELSGGATPHMQMTVEAARREADDLEKLWWLGCYVMGYNFALAEILAMRWRPGEWADAELEAWLTEHWKGIPLHRYRKTVNSPRKLTSSLRSYATYITETLPQREWYAERWWPTGKGPGELWAEAFDDIKGSVHRIGRYMSLRWTEGVRRTFDMAMVAPDIRAEGGTSPRTALSLFYPEHAEVLLGGDSPSEVAQAEALAALCRAQLLERHGVHAEFYTLQVLLCEYKQYVRGKQFPGKSVDSELRYWDAAYEHWGRELAERTIMFDVRKALFPEWALGEANGWRADRKELGHTLPRHGYTWSDAIYDYHASKTDLGHPIVRWDGLQCLYAGLPLKGGRLS